MLATVGYAKKDGRSEQDEHATILEFRTMAGNSGVFIGATTPIRGINAGGAPWTFAPGGRARGELRGDGRLEIEVRGLVLADDPAVPVTQRLTNPVPNFRAIVSCVSTDGMDHNIMTGLFPADTAGNSNIEATVQLPASCIAPIVFVTSPGGGWFAATGR